MKKIIIFATLVVALVSVIFLNGCSSLSKNETTDPSNESPVTSTTLSPAPTVTPPSTDGPSSGSTTSSTLPTPTYPKLGWTNSTKPERDQWTKTLIGLVEEHFAALDGASDIGKFCSKYSSMNHEMRVKTWAEIFVAIIYYESAWDANSGMDESGRLQGIRSEGLFQLSWQDEENYGGGNYFCGLTKQNILDPTINLKCGVKIMARQISKYKKIVVSSYSQLYWAVIYDGGKYERTDSIIARVKKAVPCN